MWTSWSKGEQISASQTSFWPPYYLSRVQFSIIIVKASLFTEHVDVVSVLLSSDNTIMDCPDRFGYITLPVEKRAKTTRTWS